MKLQRFVAILTTGLVLFACENKEAASPTKPSGGTWSEASSDREPPLRREPIVPRNTTEQEEYRKNTQASLDEISQRLAIWKEQASKADGTRKTELHQDIANVETRLNEAQAQWAQLTASSTNDWNNQKSKMDIALLNLKQNIDEATPHFQN